MWSTASARIKTLIRYANVARRYPIPTEQHGRVFPLPLSAPLNETVMNDVDINLHR